MLILTRKLGESITIGEDIKVTLLDSKGKYIRVVIEAPRNIAVHRDENHQRSQEQNREPDGSNMKTKGNGPEAET
jgi:carbon storage regulator